MVCVVAVAMVVVIVRGRPSTVRVVAIVPAADAAFLGDVSEEEGIVVVLLATG